MKLKNLTPITLAVLISFLSANITQAETTWYPFPLADTLSVSSPANVGALVLDAPAGKHGFLTIKDGRFFFTNGTPVQFWGTGLVGEAVFPTKEEAKLLVDRIAFMGYNAVRLNNMEFAFAPFGINKDTNPTATNPQLKTTGTLDEKQMDKMDYLVYLLKQKGIYVVLDLLNGRQFTEADGLKDAAKFYKGARPISLTDPFLIEAQKKYAMNLLTHYNPYTQMQYRNDPAVAFIEINNEVSLIEAWKNDLLNGLQPGQTTSLPSYHVMVFNWQWNNWLRGKYKTYQNVIDAWAFKGNLNDTVVLSSPDSYADWTLNAASTTTAKLTLSSRTATINVTKVNGSIGAIQYGRFGLNIRTDKTYKISFKGSASTTAPVFLNVKGGSKLLMDTKNFSFTPTARNFEIILNPSAAHDNGQMYFSIGSAIASIKLQDLTVTEYPQGALAPKDTNTRFDFARPLFKDLAIITAQKAQDINEFMYAHQNHYFNKMSRHLRVNVKTNVPIVGVSGTKMIEDLSTLSSVDIIDYHFYWDHPNYPVESFSKTNFRIKNTSMLLEDKLSIVGKLQSKIEVVSPKQAITMTEWNHCFPNVYAYETPLLLAAFQKSSRVDGMFHFSMTGYPDVPGLFKKIQDNFSVVGNTQQLVLQAVGSFLVKKAPKASLKTTLANRIFTIDSPVIQGAAGAISGSKQNFSHLSISAYDNAAIFVHSLDGAPLNTSKKLLVTVTGQTKDTNSGWNSDGTYNLGTAPVLLQKINATLSLTNSNSLKAYALNQNGTRDKVINTTVTNGSVVFSTNNVESPWIELNVQ